jgi:hypothetical protein
MGDGGGLAAPVVLQCPKFTVDPASEEMDQAVMTIVEDTYEEVFYIAPHYNYINIKGDEAVGIVSVKANPQPVHQQLSSLLDLGSSFEAMYTNRDGHSIFDLPSTGIYSLREYIPPLCLFPPFAYSCFSSKGIELSDAIEEFLNHRAQKEVSFYEVKRPPFPFLSHVTRLSIPPSLMKS